MPGVHTAHRPVVRQQYSSSLLRLGVKTVNGCNTRDTEVIFVAVDV